MQIGKWQWKSILTKFHHNFHEKFLFLHSCSWHTVSILHLFMISPLQQHPFFKVSENTSGMSIFTKCHHNFHQKFLLSMDVEITQCTYQTRKVFTTRGRQDSYTILILMLYDVRKVTVNLKTTICNNKTRFIKEM